MEAEGSTYFGRLGLVPACTAVCFLDVIANSSSFSDSRSLRWSYGGNRVQTKAEDKILGEVGTTLQAIAGIMPQNAGSRKLVQAKQDLLHLLLENERIRLGVWLSPLEHKNYATAAARNKNTPEVGGFACTAERVWCFPSTEHAQQEASSLLRVAWMESRGLAIQLAARFPSSKLHGEVRRLLLNFPEKALDEPAALEILFGSALPNDVSSQLKVRMVSRG